MCYKPTSACIVFLNCCSILGMQLSWCVPLLAGVALYHFTLSIRLPAQTIYRYRNCSYSTDLFPLHSWGSFAFGNKLHPSLLIAFLEVLPHLPLIVSYLMRDLVEKQCRVVCNGKQCTISTPTLPLHMNEPKFKVLLRVRSMTVICFLQRFLAYWLFR